MPVKIVPPGLAPSPNGVTKAQIEVMKQAFHGRPAGGTSPAGQQKETTRWAHFPIKNIMDLLVVNGIATLSQTVEELMAITDNGIKVYFAQHTDINDCPVRGDDYIGRNTVVLVVTERGGSESWNDLLNDDLDNPNAVELTGFPSAPTTDPTVNPGEGSDKTNLCPPQCG